MSAMLKSCKKARFLGEITVKTVTRRREKRKNRKTYSN